MILIAGDSWGLGEWAYQDGQYGIQHFGLQKYLQEQGKAVANISVAGGSNSRTVKKIANWFYYNQNIPVEKIFVFQTEYTRDSQNGFSHHQQQTFTADSLEKHWIDQFYCGLSDLSKQYNVTIYIIGGTSDTVWLDDFSQLYPGVEIACQSLVNLIMNGQHRIDDPVFSWYDPMALEFIKQLKKRLDSDQISCLLDKITKGADRQSLVGNTPKYFLPDGKHANRYGHKLLYDFLKDQHYI